MDVNELHPDAKEGGTHTSTTTSGVVGEVDFLAGADDDDAADSLLFGGVVVQAS